VTAALFFVCLLKVVGSVLGVGAVVGTADSIRTFGVVAMRQEGDDLKAMDVGLWIYGTVAAALVLAAIWVCP
jgi:hypothetical protein